MDVAAIVLSLGLLLFVAYRGWSVIFWAPVLAVGAAALSGLPILPAYTELFMPRAANYFKLFFPVFLLGAVFGKVMEVSGMAASIAKAIFKVVGTKNAPLATVLAAAILTYGGVSMFVCVFAVYPFAAALFRESNLPKRLLPVSIFLGCFTFTMDSLPGTPQIQNLIPANYFGTTLYAAPVMGMIITFLIFGLGMAWITFRVNRALAAGEGYGEHTLNETLPDPNMKLPHWAIAIIPLVSVLVVYIISSKVIGTWPAAIADGLMADPIQPIRELKNPPPLVVAGVKNVATTWALIIGLIVAISLCMVLNFKTMIPTGVGLSAISAGAIGSLLAIVNTASEVGYGNVIAALPGFAHLASAMSAIEQAGGTLLAEAITVNMLAGITGSASGGMSIALDLFRDQWVMHATAAGIPVEVLHRVAAIAAGGMDTLPHNGAVITLLAVCGLTHRQSYPDMFVLTLAKIAMAFVAVFLYSAFGIV